MASWIHSTQNGQNIFFLHLSWIIEKFFCFSKQVSLTWQQNYITNTNYYCTPKRVTLDAYYLTTTRFQNDLFTTTILNTDTAIPLYFWTIIYYTRKLVTTVDLWQWQTYLDHNTRYVYFIVHMTIPVSEQLLIYILWDDKLILMINNWGFASQLKHNLLVIHQMCMSMASCK